MRHAVFRERQSSSRLGGHGSKPIVDIGEMQSRRDSRKHNSQLQQAPSMQRYPRGASQKARTYNEIRSGRTQDGSE